MPIGLRVDDDNDEANYTVSIGCGGVFVGVWVAFWSLFTLGFDVMCVRGLYLQAAAAGYPTARGRVLESSIESRPGRRRSDSATSVSRIHYAYVVEGQTYDGRRWRYGVAPSGEGEAERLVASYPAGREIDVCYNPRDPADAILLPGVSGADAFMMLFATPFNVIMLGAWAVCSRALRNRLIDPAARFRRRVHYRGTTPVIRLPGVSPLLAAGVAALASSFVLIFGVAFSTGMQPSVATVVVTLAGVAAAAIFAAYRTARSPRLGGRELVVDSVRRTVTLPLGGKQFEPETVAFGAIAGVYVDRKLVGAANRIKSARYPVELSIGRPGQAPRRLELATFDSKGEANAMRDWVADQIGLKAAASAAGTSQGT